MDIAMPRQLKRLGFLTVLVTGGRTYHDEHTLGEALDRIDALCDEHHVHMRVLEGGAQGADRIARRWALLNHTLLVIERADWLKHGRAAGPRRNQRMIDKHAPDLCLAAPGGKGTADMVSRCEAASIPVVRLANGHDA